MQGGIVESVEKLERLLDNVCAQHNLKELARQKLLHKIPAVAPCAPGSHIITPDLEPSIKIPRAVTLQSPQMPPHVKAFHEGLKLIAPDLKNILKGKGHLACSLVACWREAKICLRAPTCCTLLCSPRVMVSTQ